MDRNDKYDDCGRFPASLLSRLCIVAANCCESFYCAVSYACFCIWYTCHIQAAMQIMLECESVTCRIDTVHFVWSHDSIDFQPVANGTTNYHLPSTRSTKLGNINISNCCDYGQLNNVHTLKGTLHCLCFLAHWHIVVRYVFSITEYCHTKPFV